MSGGTGRDHALSEVLLTDATLLGDEPDAEWALRPRERLESARQEARLALARDRARGLGRSSPEAVVQAWEDCLGTDATCEEAACALVRLHSARGRRSSAEATYRRCQAALLDLGLAGSPALEEAHAVAVPPVPSGPASLAPVGADHGPEELRLVSVLFAELSVPYGGGIGPEELKELLSGALASLLNQVEAFGGTVTSVSGAGMEAVFGAPVSHEDDPERAVRAAYRMQPDRGGSSGGMTVHTGVETGPAVVGPTATGYAAVGEVAGTAAFLASVAMDASVLVGPVTRAAVEAVFEWGPDEELARRASKPIVASYLERPKARPGAPGRHLAWAAPLVGRAPELSVLDDALRGAVSGTGGVVFVVGEPGLGKTRLVSECRKRFMAWVGAGSGRLPLWLEGRGASYASSVPYGLYQQLLSAWIGVSPEEGEEMARPALERAMRAVLGQPSELLPLVAHMMGFVDVQDVSGVARTSPEALQRATFGAVREVISRLVAWGPTVLVLEDLHWADPTSLRLTEELAPLARDGPLLVLITRRPEPDPGVSALEASLCSDCRLRSQKLELSPFPSGDEVSLARSLLGEGATKDVVEAVRASTDGNPLFMEERLSSLLESGALVKDQDGWHLDRGVASQLPEALERLIRSRVDRLGLAARETVVAASVLGAEFSLPELGAVSPVEGGLPEALSELCSGGLLTEVPQQARPVYRFRHALIREATYGGIVKAERRRLHARAAWALEESSADRLEEVAATLGHHYAAAGETERALHFLQVAGDRAASVFANEEAVSSYRTALAVIGQGDLDAKLMAKAALKLRAKLAEVLWHSTHHEAAWEVLHEAVGEADPDDGLQAARLYNLLGRVELGEGRVEAALAAFYKGEELLGEDPEEQGQDAVDLWLELLLQGRAQVYYNLDQPDRIAALLAEVRPQVEARGGPKQKQAFYTALIYWQLTERRYHVDEEVLASARAALAAAERGCGEYEIGWRLYDVGFCLLLHGDLAEAEENLTAALGISKRIGDADMQVLCLCYLKLTALRRHDLEAVASLAPQAIEGTDAASCEYAGVAKASLAWLAWKAGRVPEVEALAEEALAFMRTTVWHPFHWVCLWPLIAVRLAGGQIAEAIDASQQLLVPPQMRLPDELESAVETAGAAWDKGDRQLARAKLIQALELAEQLGYL